MGQDYPKMDEKLGTGKVSKNALSLINDNQCKTLQCL